MIENNVREEILYTYEAAINRYERERHHDYLCRQKQLKQSERNKRQEEPISAIRDYLDY